MKTPEYLSHPLHLIRYAVNKRVPQDAEATPEDVRASVTAHYGPDEAKNLLDFYSSYADKLWFSTCHRVVNHGTFSTWAPLPHEQ